VADPFVGFGSIPAICFGGSLFVAAVLLTGYLTPGYSHIHQSISELGARNVPYSWLVRWAGFVPLGVSFVLLASQSGSLFSNHMPSLLILITGLAIILAGIFPTDSDNRRNTPSGKVHASVVIVLLFLLTLAPFTFSISALYRDPPEGWLLDFSFFMGVAVLGFYGMLPNDACPRLVALHRKILGRFLEMWYPLQGLHQRLQLALFGIWWIVFTLVLADP
jgi:hypothetical membrane protein